MPDIFHRKAFEAVCRDEPKILAKLRPEHFQEARGLDEALGWLTPQQRCDAVYASWLESVNGPDSGVLLEVRKRLIQQGGLSANYLAEFAQNADDAYPMGQLGGEVHIWRRADWLFVVNNGRRFTGNDLHGLCRFFANGSKITATEETIGKFGIGFKSCYRIGSEVWVRTWDRKEAFAFRLPLCSSTLPQSYYDPETFRRVIGLLGRTNSRTSQDELGYCTPEFREGCPDEIDDVARQAQAEFPAHGAVFAVHLHARGSVVLSERLRDQRTQVFELCPLFLPKVRTTKLEDTTLRLIEHDTLAERSVPQSVQAERVTIEAQTGAGTRSNARFWRLTEAGADKPWRIALHADGSFRLNLRREEGETTSLRDGSAYAFFPLSIPWPLRLHLHLNLPTNLDRSNWSPENPDEVRQQIVAAVDSLGRWLEQSRELWHEDWRVAQLIEREPTQPISGQFTSKPAWWVFEELKSQVLKRRLLRTLTGDFGSGSNARMLKLREGVLFRDAWRQLGTIAPEAWTARTWCSQIEAECWGLKQVGNDALLDFTREVVAEAKTDSQKDERSQLLLCALVGISTERRALLDEALKLLRVGSEDVSLIELFGRSGGASLSPAWHELFGKLASLFRETEFGEITVASRELWKQFQRFSKPAFNPPWSSVPRVMHPSLDPAKWEEFWSAAREPCPSELAEQVLAVLRVSDSQESMKPLDVVWVHDRTVPIPFRSVFCQVLPSRQQGYVTKLKQWGLWETHEKRAGNRLNGELAKSAVNSLRTALAQGSFADWLDQHRKNLIEGERLAPMWHQIVDRTGVAAVKEVVEPQLEGFRECVVLSHSIPAATRSVITLLRDYVDAPSWLDDRVLGKLREVRLETCLAGLRLVTKAELGNRTSEIARKLLGAAFEWETRSLDATQLAALNQLFAATTITERRQFSVGLAPRTFRVVADFVAIADTASDPNAYWLAHAKNAADFRLPQHLALLPSIVEACGRTAALTLKIEGLPTTALDYPCSAIDPEIANLPPVRQLLTSARLETACQHSPLDLEWWDGDHRVCRVEDASFAYAKGRLYVSRLAVNPDDRQFQIVLADYLNHAARDPEVDQAWQEATQKRTPLISVYNCYRDRILRVLRRAYTEKVGYEAVHVWRELLQNAESAYASMPDPRPDDRYFDLVVEDQTDDRCQIAASNVGRRFNADDRDGNRRNDIDRIVSVGSERLQTEHEIGRYNLGFKSVFSVTDTVAVTSGGYAFEIKDLLLRHPYQPESQPTKTGDPTVFRWKCRRQESLSIVGLPSNASRTASPRFLRSQYAIFTRYVTRMRIVHRGHESTLYIRRTDENGQTRLQITLPDNTTEHFFVMRATLPSDDLAYPYRFAVAIRCGVNGLPEPVPLEERFFHLVYPTEHKAFVSFVLDADFEPEAQNRRTLRDSRRNLSLILAAVRLVYEKARAELDAQFTNERWLAWAKVLAPTELSTGAAFFSDKSSEVDRLVSEIRRMLLQRVPHRGRAVPADQLIVPTQLMRRFALQHGALFQIRTEDWIDETVQEVTHVLGLDPNLRLSEWVGELDQDDGLLARVSEALETFPASNIEVDEISRARHAIRNRLSAILPLPLPAWDLERLILWWKENLDEDPYTLSGDSFGWICPDSSIREPVQRSKLLQSRLSNPSNKLGKDCWYRTLAFACLLSTGRRHTEVLNFEQTLSQLDFLGQTSGSAFSPIADQVFSDLTQRSSGGLDAQGEQADFWRRVFYDVRKVHRLVFDNEFASVFFELCQRKDLADNLIGFLRSGFLPGQPKWKGVLGQSTLVPLFFLIRELRRLNVIDHNAADGSAFFVCRPVRRAARKLGWITQEQEERTDVDSLLQTSNELYRRLSEIPEASNSLLPYFDIPLLALEQSGELDLIP